MEQTTEDEDLYKLVSGFYGPGSMSCWYLLVASVGISWALDPRQRLRVTNDLIAAVAYPTVAAGHLLIQMVNFPGSGVQYMVVNLINLIAKTHNGPVKLGEESSKYHYPADLSSPERTEVYPRVASINASLRVVETFTYLAWIVLHQSLLEKNDIKAQFRQTCSLVLMVGGSLILSWAAELVLYIKIWTSAAHGGWDLFVLSPLMRLFLCLWPVYCIKTLVCLILFAIEATTNILRIYRHPDPLQKIHQHWENWTRGTQAVRDGDNHPRILNTLKIFLKPALIFFGILALLAMWVAFGIFLYLACPTLLLFPPVGSTLMELDQAAALAGGLFNLGLTLLRALRRETVMDPETGEPLEGRVLSEILFSFMKFLFK